ncbi:MAG: GNAT family N-acetyltransferase [Chlamydiota bacterium]
MKSEGVLTLAAARPLEAAGSLTAEVVTDFRQLAELAEEWEQLWEASPSATIFQSPSWARAWWRGFGDQVQLCTPVVWEGRRVAGILPLVRAGSVLRFLGMPGADYNDFLCHEELTPEVMEAALRTLLRTEGWRTCRLNRLREDSQFVRYAAQLPADLRRHLNLFPVARRTALVLRQDRDSVIAGVQRKAALKRHRNKLYRTGEVRFRHIETRAEAQQLLPTLFHQHITRRALAGEFSQFLAPDWRNFYAALLQEFDLRRQLRFSVLEFDGQLIACEIAFERKGTLLLYKPTFDVNAWELSPGDVLLSEMLEHARQRVLEEIDFTIGDEPYKEHFTNFSAPVLCAVVERNAARSRLRRLWEPGTRFVQNEVLRALRRRLPAELDRLRACPGRLRRALQTRKQGAAWLYVGDQERADGASDSRFSVQPARLSDLAELAIGDPRFFDPKLLQEYRLRLRNGDRCHVLRNHQHQHLVWTRRITLPESFHREGEQGLMPADVLYDVRPIGRSGAAPLDAGLMEWFAGYASSGRALACVYLNPGNGASRKAMQQAGFQRRTDLIPHFQRQTWPW